VADPVQHAKGRLRKEAPKDLSQRGLMLDLIAVADDDRNRRCHRIESGADVFDHAALGPGTLGAHRMTDQRVALEPDRVRNRRDIVGDRRKVVASIRRDRAAPASLIERDRARLLAGPVNHALPCSR
jgi:hypothetical protein